MMDASPLAQLTEHATRSFKNVQAVREAAAQLAVQPPVQTPVQTPVQPGE